MPEEFLSQLNHQTQDQNIKRLVSTHFQEVVNIIELYEEWQATHSKFDDDFFLYDPPGCFQC